METGMVKWRGKVTSNSDWSGALNHRDTECNCYDESQRLEYSGLYCIVEDTLLIYP